MKVSEVLKCVASGVSTDEVKDIMALNHTSADEAIELVKAGYTSKTLQGLLDEPKPEPEPQPDPQPQPNPQPDPQQSEELEKLRKELEETQAKLQKAQQANLRQDVGLGEKPDPEEYLAKLFAQ
jgi:DNA-binding transcriptional MerR regulator